MKWKQTEGFSEIENYPISIAVQPPHENCDSFYGYLSIDVGSIGQYKFEASSEEAAKLDTLQLAYEDIYQIYDSMKRLMIANGLKPENKLSKRKARELGYTHGKDDVFYFSYKVENGLQKLKETLGPEHVDFQFLAIEEKKGEQHVDNDLLADYYQEYHRGSQEAIDLCLVYPLIYRYEVYVEWSKEDKEYVALCKEFPSLSFLNANDHRAKIGMYDLIKDVIKDMRSNGEEIPKPICQSEEAIRSYRLFTE